MLSTCGDSALLKLAGCDISRHATDTSGQGPPSALREIKQWPSLGVETKNDKSATTFLLDIPDLLTVVEKWDAFIRPQLPPTAMWYTPTISRWGVQTLSADRPGANRNLAISKHLHRLFDLAGLP